MIGRFSGRQLSWFLVVTLPTTECPAHEACHIASIRMGGSPYLSLADYEKDDHYSDCPSFVVVGHGFGVAGAELRAGGRP